MSHLSDEELIGRCARGESSAMDTLVGRYHGRLLDFALRSLGDREAAADVAQTALIRAFESAASFRGRASFKTWLYAIAHNLIREEFRRRRRQSELLLSEIEAADGERLPPEADDLRSAEDRAIERVEALALWRAVDELSEQHRMAIVLRFRLGLKYEEISEVTGAPCGTVRSWVHYALKALRKSLDPASCEG